MPHQPSVIKLDRPQSGQPLTPHRLPLAEFERGVNLIKNKQERVRKMLITPNA